ncbi:hypothetical protein [Prosthecobacter sp.]|uniref:hypothetical protein n=1 Tax=Prosthecobacter sp. TaxID=1965333 RepID=UPI0037847BDB
MRLFLPLILGFSLFQLCQPARGEEDPAALRVTLEKVYGNWRDAMLRKDANAWAASITLYRQTVIRNAVVSERLPFPEAVFASEVQPPSLGGLRLLEAQAVGDTAHLVYFGRIDMGQDKELIRENILKLKFFRENGTWKYDSNRISRLDGAPEVLKTLQEGKRPDFLDSPEYTPPGTAPAPPPLCRVPDYKAGCKLQTFGYETTMSMNGITYEPVRDGLDQQILIGGLIKGHNEITLHIKPVPRPEGEKPALQIRVYILPKEPGKPGTEVLRWEAPESGAPAKVTLPIEVKS